MAKEIHKRISVWLNQQGIENNLKSVRAAINKTANELAKLPIGTEEWYRKSEKLKKLKDIQVELQKEIKTTSAEIEKHNRKLNNTIVNIGAIASAYTGASIAIRRILFLRRKDTHYLIQKQSSRSEPIFVLFAPSASFRNPKIDYFLRFFTQIFTDFWPQATPSIGRRPTFA